MKLTAILLTIVCLQASAHSAGQTVTLRVKNAPMKQVFTEIQKQTGLNVFVEQTLLDKAGRVTLDVREMPVPELLNICLKNEPLNFKIEGGAIVIREEIPGNMTSDSGLRTSDIISSIDISGRVTDSDGNPLAGASVKVKGTTNGTTTDASGVFVLKGVDENAVLIFSYAEHETVELKVGNRTSISAALKKLETSLQEVVIQKGYYTEKQRFSVGNAATVTAAEIERHPVQNPMLALQGKIPGIEITQLTGLPGGGVTLRIQGQNSIRKGTADYDPLNPLIIVDGVPYPSQLFSNSREGLLQGGSPLNYIDPSNIESITVLKDADATSIYGSRAANGAILITTKKGKVGKTKVIVNLQHGWGKVTRQIDMMNTRQYLDMRYEAYKNDGINLALLSPGGTNYDLTLWDTTRYTNWQKTLIGGTAQYTNINTSITGGTATMQYLVGGTYRKQTTVFPGSFDDKSGGLNFNISGASSNHKLRIQLSGGYLFDRNHIPGVDLTKQAVLLEPNAPSLYQENGTLNWAPNATGASTWNNPLAPIFSTDFHYTSNSLVSNATVHYDIVKGLEINSNFGFNTLRNDLYQPNRLEMNPPELRPNRTRTAFYQKRDMSTWIIEPQIKYSGRIGSGDIEGLVGVTFQQNSTENWNVSGSGYANDQLMKSIQGSTSTSISTSSTLYKYNALFGRVNYNWDKKYIINLTARCDGSSRFGDKNKFHNFWSGGLGWIITEEKWVQQNLSFLSFGKLRVSYGTTGNDQIGDYKYISTYNITPTQIPYQNISSLDVTGIPNPHLQWEETRKLQSGVDVGFAQDRVILGITYSMNVSSNQLTNYNLPAVTGFSFVDQNLAASIRNTSWEFSLNTSNVKGRNFNWTSNFNLTIPKNKLVSFSNIELTSYASGTSEVIVGQPLGILKVYPYAGIDPGTGKYLVFDIHGNMTSNGTDVMQNVLVNPAAIYYGGLSNSISFRGFQLDFTFQFVRRLGAREMYYSNSNGKLPGGFAFRNSNPNNQPVSLVNRWQKPGDDAEFGKFTTSAFGYTQWPILSDAYYNYDASYIRLKNLSISWQLPSKWRQSAKLQNCLFYFRGENLITITKYTGLDPETQTINTLPPLQMWTAGVKVDL